MGRYTVHNNKLVDEKLDNYFNQIVERIIDVVGKENIKAIVLFGSFGRGEGGVVIENKKVIPVNDFDITIFVNNNLTHLRNLYSEELEESAQILSKKIGIKQIDLDLSHPFTLLFAKMNNANYERYHGHKLLFGSISIKKRMLKPNYKKIKNIDGTNYFLSRGSGLVLSAYCLNKYSVNTPKVIVENFEIEINKAILAIGDSYLIKNKKYHFLYTQRIKNAKQLSFSDIENSSEIKQLYIDALNWKLKPSFKYQNKTIQIEKLKHILNLFSKYFLWFESERLNKNFSDWINYSEQIIHLQKIDLNFLFRKSVLDFLNNPKNFFKRFNFNKITSNALAVKLSIMTLILFSYVDSENSNLMKDKANLNLKYFYKVQNNNEWTSLAEEYLKVFHPNGLLNFIFNDLKLLNK